ncbi:hypothetical protein KPH14_008161 [Odynerus spinipes]|uniref:Uncharacterized protein n=1 Tax=Odynerus spinipes TaxID=1348599 RepID=A0AAD9VHZ2_9HYME|nr:hypothetical protein KPH14_008161 [Odynerus spinipes]
MFHRKQFQIEFKKEAYDEDDIEDLVEPSLSPALSTTPATSVASMSSVASNARLNKQPRLDMAFFNQKSFQDGGSKASDLTNRLLFMIVKDNMPFQIVENEGFKAYTKGLCPLFKLPSRKTVTSLIEEKYQVLSNMIKTQLSTVEHLSLTTDVWTDPLNTKSFLGITGHFVLNEEHKSVTIGVTELDERHTSRKVASEDCRRLGNKEREYNSGRF